MDIGNGFTQWLIKQGTLGAVLIVVLFMGYSNINARFDSVNKRIDGVQADIQQIKEGQRELIGYMKDHEGRIANIEGRLDERQQQPAT